MFDMSWGEIMVIGGVALIVIGPKDLPKALRTVGQMTAKVRRMAGEFQAQFSDAMREAELEDVRKEVEGLSRGVASATSAAFNPIQTIRDEIKGSVDAPVRPSDLPVSHTADLPPPDWSAGTEPAFPPPEPARPAFPETHPLVPLPVDEPALPAVAPPPPSPAASAGPEPLGAPVLPAREAQA